MKDKTEKEIFEERYPLSEVVKNPFKITSALGYLECLKEHELSEDWVDRNIASLLVTLYDIRSKVTRWENVITILTQVDEEGD